MARRRKAQSDSLELLLDTISNTFGGVLFIAILVVILLQTSGNLRPPDERPRRADPVALERLGNRLEVLQSEIARARESSAGQTALFDRFASEEARAMLRKRRKLREEAAQRAAKRNEMLLENGRAAEDIEEIRAEVEAVRERLAAARERAEELEDKIAELQAQRTEEARTPVLHSPGLKAPIGIILRYGRMYVWHRYDRFGRRLGLNIDDFVVVEERDDTIVTAPLPTAGVELADTPQSRRAVRGRLQTFDPDDAYITAIVRPDSFRQFRHLRDVLVEMGFKYRLMPLSEGAPVADRGGTGGQVQ